MGGKGSWKGAGKGKGKGKGKDNVASQKAEAPPTLNMPLGMSVKALHKDGAWYDAWVVQVRESTRKVKVDFGGYEEAWVGVDDVWAAKGKKSAATTGATDELPQVGARCQADAGQGKFHSAQVLQVSPKRADSVKVAIEMWVRPDQLKAVQKLAEDAPAPKTTAKSAAKSAATGQVDLPVGTQLQAMFSDGKLYKAEVVQVRKGKTPVKVHFMGWDVSMDEWKSLDDIKSKLLPKGESVAEAEPSKKSKGAADTSAEGKGKAKGKGKKGKNAGGYEDDYSSPDWPAKPKGKGKGKAKAAMW